MKAIYMTQAYEKRQWVSFCQKKKPFIFLFPLGGDLLTELIHVLVIDKSIYIMYRLVGWVA